MFGDGGLVQGIFCKKIGVSRPSHSVEVIGKGGFPQWNLLMVFLFMN